MKQLKTLVLSLPFVLAAVGCSQDELLPDGGKGTNVPEGMHEVEVTFNMGTNSGLQTRSVHERDVISSDNWQRVTNVRIYVFKGNEEMKDKEGKPITDKEGNPITFDPNKDECYFYHTPSNSDGKSIPYIYVSNFADKKKDWGENDVWGDDENEQENEHYVYSAKLQLNEGYYKFLAIGRDDIDENNLENLNDLTMTIPDLDYPEDYTNLPNFKDMLDGISTLDFKENDPNWNKDTSLSDALIQSSGYSCSELFSGVSETISVTSGVTGFSSTITLNRAVAGMLFYVENIPTKVKALVSYYDDNFIETLVEKGKEYSVVKVSIAPLEYFSKVNLASRKPAGVAASNKNNRVGFTLTNCFISLRDELNKKTEDEDCFVGENISEKHPNGTFLLGTFLLPQNTVSSTLTVGDAIDGNPDTQAILDKSLYLVFMTSFGGGASFEYPIYWIPIYNKTLESYTFSMDANSFYSIGLKNHEKGEDKPIDLKPGGDDNNNLVLTVHPNWEGVSELPLE